MVEYKPLSSFQMLRVERWRKVGCDNVGETDGVGGDRKGGKEAGRKIREGEGEREGSRRRQEDREKY